MKKLITVVLMFISLGVFAQNTPRILQFSSKTSEGNNPDSIGVTSTPLTPFHFYTAKYIRNHFGIKDSLVFDTNFIGLGTPSDPLSINIDTLFHFKQKVLMYNNGLPITISDSLKTHRLRVFDSTYYTDIFANYAAHFAGGIKSNGIGVMNWTIQGTDEIGLGNGSTDSIKLSATRVYATGGMRVVGTPSVATDVLRLTDTATLIQARLSNGTVKVLGDLLVGKGITADSASVFTSHDTHPTLTLNQGTSPYLALEVNGGSQFDGQSFYNQYVQYNQLADYESNIDISSAAFTPNLKGILWYVGTSHEFGLQYSSADSSLHYSENNTPNSGNRLALMSDITGGGTTTNALTLGYGLLGASFNGSTAVTAKVDTSSIQTILNFFPKGDTRYLKSTTAGSTYVPLTRTLTAGVGVNTIGDLSANRTVSLDTTSTVVSKIFAGRYVTTNSAASLASLTLSGTAGAGFVEYPTQSSPPSTPASGKHREYTNSSGQLSFLGSNGFAFSLSRANLTASRVFTFPDSTGTFALESRIIPNASLANSAITINGSPVSLGGSITVTGSTTAALTMNNSGSGVASGTTFDGGTARTLSYNTLGASPLAGSSSFTIIGTIGSSPYTTAGIIHNTVTTGALTSSLIVNADITNSTIDLTTKVTGTLPVANGGTGVTTSTGSTNVVLSNSPTLVTPVLGTPTSVTLTNGTGLPLTTGVTGILPYANGGTNASTSWTQGSVFFAGASAYSQDNANYFYDGTNHRLGLITAAPTHSLTLGTGGNFAMYNTSDQTTNYERLAINWGSNVLTFGTQAGGSGTGRNFSIGTPTRQMLMVEAANTSTGFYQFATGTSLANGVGTAYQGTWNPSSGASKIVEIAPTITGTSTSGYTALWISPFESSVGSGNTYLIDAGTNSSGSGGGTHTTKFNVLSNGNTSVIGTLTVTGTTTMNGNIASTATGSTSNFFTNGGGLGLVNTAAAGALFGGASNASGRVLMNGTSSTTLTAGNSYGGLIVGAQPVTMTSTGTPAWLANAVINGLGTVTNATPITITNTASLYVGGASAAGTNNYTAFFATGNVRVDNGNLTLGTAGNGISIKEGTNGSMGTGTLSSGTLVVSTTKVTANSRIFITDQGGTITNLGTLYVSARTAGTSFTVSSSNVLDASNFAWIIIEPAP